MTTNTLFLAIRLFPSQVRMRSDTNLQCSLNLPVYNDTLCKLCRRWLAGWVPQTLYHHLEQVLDTQIHKLTCLTVGSAITEIDAEDMSRALDWSERRHLAFSLQVRVGLSRLPISRA